MSYIPSSSASTALKELLRDANANAAANNFLAGYTTTATSGGTKTLDAGSTSQQFFTGTTTHTVVLPITSSLALGQQFQIVNNSTGTITVQSSGANNILLMPGSSVANFTCISLSGTGISSWFAQNLTSGATLTPTIQTFTSSSGTYTTPANVAYIRVRMVGGGGGGGGSGTASAGSGGNGGDSTFGTSLLTAGGGQGANTYQGGTAGTASLGTGPIGTALSGSKGGGGSNENSALDYIAGGWGGNSAFGGGGGSTGGGAAGSNGTTNTGGGGAGGGTNAITSDIAGGGGGSSGYVDAIIVRPTTSYSYAVGTAGTAGGAGTNGFAGGSGGSGYIEVTEYYLNATLGNGGLITPTQQRFTTGTAQTYTTPNGVAYLKIRISGAGGGGGGGGTTNGTAATAGTASTFGSILTANGGGLGVAGQSNGAGGAGGTATVSAPAFGTPITGGNGSGGGNYSTGTGTWAGINGGTNPLGGAGVGLYSSSGTAGNANTGAGGGSGGANFNVSASQLGGAGGAGGYAEAFVVPTAGQTFTYTVGVGGSAGGAGSNGYAGGAGADGYIEVTEYYNNGAIGTATNVTGIVAVANGGTGLTGITANRIPYANATNAYGTSSNLTFDGTTLFGAALKGTNVIVNGSQLSVSQQSLTFDGSAAFGIGIEQSNGSNTGAYINFFNNGPTGIGNIAQNGSSAVTYNTSSDYRLKENIAPMAGALDRINQLKPSTYDFISGDKNCEGFIAHELQEVVPAAVTGQKDAIGIDNKPAYQGVDYGRLTPLLVAAMQELMNKNEALEARIKDLESK